MYTYVQRPGCKKENTATYVYIRAGLERLLAHTYGQGSCTWLGRNRETTSSSCSWGGNGMRRVHGEATECVVFIGRAWTEQAMETRPGVPQNGGNGLVFDRPRSKQDPVHQEGSGVLQNGGNGPPTVETGVLLIRRGVAYRKTDKTYLCWSATVGTGVLFIGRGVAYRKTRLYRILFRMWPVEHKAVPPFCGMPCLVCIACSVQALPMNTTTHSVPTQPVGSP